VHDGDDPAFGGVRFGERSEVTGHTFHQDDERWFRHSIELDASWPAPMAAFCTLAQFHSNANGTPPLYFSIWGGTLYLIANPGGQGAGNVLWGAKALPGAKFDLVYGVRFSRTDGWVEMLVAGVWKRVWTGATMRDDANFFKEGIYRDNAWKLPGIVRHSPLEEHSARPDTVVTPPPPPPPPGGDTIESLRAELVVVTAARDQARAALAADEARIGSLVIERDGLTAQVSNCAAEVTAINARIQRAQDVLAGRV